MKKPQRTEANSKEVKEPETRYEKQDKADLGNFKAVKEETLQRISRVQDWKAARDAAKETAKASILERCISDHTVFLFLR